MLLWKIVFSESITVWHDDELSLIGPQGEPPHTILLNGTPIAFTAQLKDREAPHVQPIGKNVHALVEHRVRHGRRGRRR